MEKFINVINPIRKQENVVNPAQKIIQEAESIKIEKQDRNKEGFLLASDGTISHYQNELYWKLIKTESFKKWFTDSVAVYEDNKEPLIVFHSTLKREFVGSNLKFNEDADDWRSFGIYFSSSKEATINYYKTQYEDDINRFERFLNRESDEKELILLDKEKYMRENEDQVKTFDAFVKIQKPLELVDHQQLMEISRAGFSRQELLSKHDGIIVKYDSDFCNQYIVFKEENILVVPSEIDQSK